MHTDFLSGQQAHKGHYGDEIKFVTHFLHLGLPTTLLSFTIKKVQKMYCIYY